MGRLRMCVVTATALLCVLTAAAVASRPVQHGKLDPRFGSHGVAWLRPACDSEGEGLARDARGRLLVAGAAGTCEGDINRTPVVLRLTALGRSDPSFGAKGVSGRLRGVGIGRFMSVARAPGGKVIAAGGVDDVGMVGAGALVARYLPDGRPDPSFGSGGVAAAPSAARFTGTFRSVAALPGGGVIAGGDLCAVAQEPRPAPVDPVPVDPYAVDPSAVDPAATAAQAPDTRCGSALARFRPDGSPDPSFGDGGVVIGAGPSIAALSVVAGGRIATVGTSGTEGDLLEPGAVVAVARYREDGSLDPSFGTGGIVTTKAARLGARGEAIVARPGGGLLVSATGLDPELKRRTATRLVAYRADGSLDASFGSGGIVSPESLDYAREPRSLALAADGSVWTLVSATRLPLPFASDPSRHTVVFPLHFSARGKLVGGGETIASRYEMDGRGLVLGPRGAPVALASPSRDRRWPAVGRWVP